MPGPSASGPTPFCQVRVLLSISGRGWSLHSSKVGLHRPSQWPLPVLAWGHLLSKLPADPQTFANPLCLCSCRASSWMPSLPSPSRPQKSPLITRSTRVLMQEVLFVCFLSFQDPFSCSPAPWPGKAEVPRPRQVLRSSRCPKPLEVCIALNLHIYLWTALPTPRGSSQPATSVLAPTQGLAPPPALNAPVARVPGSWVYALQFKQVRKNSSLLPCRWRVQTSNQQEQPAPPPPGSLKTYLLP